mmetsp:Transcript_15265/g.23680  ORF Transcript_15265/g.23680 Transcript_15265/m.23680 type:complete len:99 (+) Transcript_15265:70-366(+)
MALRSLETWASKDSKARVLADLATRTDSSDSESLSITQRLPSPRPPPTEESLELEESSDESDELEESSDPAAAQNFDMVFNLLALQRGTTMSFYAVKQ